MKKDVNPKLQPGDRVICIHMQGELLNFGNKGTVKRVIKDPFESGDHYIYEVSWDNGSSLSLLSVSDYWKKIESSKINEQLDDRSQFFIRNIDLIRNFEIKFFVNYLNKIRNSGIINMFAVAPLLYAGKKHIDRYYGEGKEDSEEFQEVLNDADKSRDKLALGVLNYMMDKNLDIEDERQINALAKKFSQGLLEFYMRYPTPIEEQ